MQTVEIADAAAFERTLRRLAHQILENNPEPEQVLLVGILRRGVPLAEELAGLMERFGGVRPPVETLDICLLYTSPSPRDGLLSRMPSSA